MPLDLSDTLVVGITATALFDLSEEDSVFQEKYKSDQRPQSKSTESTWQLEKANRSNLGQAFTMMGLTQHY